ncbi:glycogenin glucosyltransferase [Madurella fahalii]|uniref:Glycogenin glucosyltransferase n=1 Tax=Madurella fahalii TaxID=1157608 RepID=A0ABQ0G9C4_9PEZI
MTAQGEEDVYASLLLTDNYLPGALVLAHSLRDAGTTKKLAVLVTLDSVSADVITQLKAVYDYVIPVCRIRNERPANLGLMNRPDLHSAFTKINLWKQTQFRKIVYVDADVVAYRAPDELFNLPHAFSAAPDIGWPDLFNTGVMVLTPNMGDYHALMALAERGISFDGADQGLLNTHFQNSFNRLSFTYNVTPSAHYQYVPAYKHYQSSINMVHFIGSDKPWVQGRGKTTGSSPFDEMVGRWWAVYDRHYRKESTASQTEQKAPEIVQYFVKGEFQPTIRYVLPVGEPPRDQSGNFYGQQYQPPGPSHVDHSQQQRHTHRPHSQPQQHPNDYPYHRHHHELHPHQHHHEHLAPAPSIPSAPTVSSRPEEMTHAEAREDQASDRQQWNPPPPSEPEHKPEPQPEVMPSWDAQRHPPPPDSKPEAMNFPQTHYEMSSDLARFVPPERYPSPPKNMWYEVPKERPAHPKEKPKPIFPWETHKPQPTREFSPHQEPPASIGEPSSRGSQLKAEPAMTWPTTAEQLSQQQSTLGPSIRTALSAPSDIWSSFPRTNAWDELPEINRYVDIIQKRQRKGGRIPGLRQANPPSGEQDASWGRRGSRVTDFPSEDDRPSLPVTPAPIRRPRLGGAGGPWPGGSGGDDEQLPMAEGVPSQADWDPVEQLQKLARQQSELLQQKLGSEVAQGNESIGKGGRTIPSRALPFGSEDAKSPTYVAYSPPVISPKPVKPDTGKSPVSRILAAAPELTAGQQTAPSVTTTSAVAQGAVIPIAAPSYQGPGASFEKGEDIPAYETPALPTEHDRDILDT